MVRRIAGKEWVETLRDGRFRVLAAVVLVLAVAAVGSGWARYRDVERQHREAQQATRAQWLNQPAKNPHSAAHYGMYAFKPKSRLSMVSPPGSRHTSRTSSPTGRRRTRPPRSASAT